MPIEMAIWFPFWYEMDQAIEVGAEDDFAFFRVPPEKLIKDGLPVFYNGDGNATDVYVTARKRIRAIWHTQLGDIRRIETNGLDYTFVLVDGRALKVEAEESPGLVYDLHQPVTDWRVFVEMEPA